MAKSFPEHSDARVRAVLQYLCKDSGNSFITKARGDGSLSGAAGGNEVASVIAKKRKAGDDNSIATEIENSTVQICIYCSTGFTPDSNHNRVCRSHDGTLDVDTESNFWDDIFAERPDPHTNPHAEADSEEYRKEYPEGYIWSCCNRNGTKRGCKLRAHRGSVRAANLVRWSRWYRAGYDEQRVLQEAHVDNEVKWGTVETEVKGYLEYKLGRDASRRPPLIGSGGAVAVDDDDTSEVSIGHSDDEDEGECNGEGDGEY
ncbi:hypothetical protein Micbo1qcDRAFT_205365 [Microdochium bolleyi]|uniref:C2H2-type domain-containing protein n=1 Tax=Microdochium bolleyi TaxID=196109 RepID=A0A136IZY8_9PEZI|nr:hypothetical protein Micbo1qcDRAFT_205365 [Microdochium bolleyi]